jgi:hypothetical protein
VSAVSKIFGFQETDGQKLGVVSKIAIAGEDEQIIVMRSRANQKINVRALYSMLAAGIVKLRSHLIVMGGKGQVVKLRQSGFKLKKDTFIGDAGQKFLTHGANHHDQPVENQIRQLLNQLAFFLTTESQRPNRGIHQYLHGLHCLAFL